MLKGQTLAAMPLSIWLALYTLTPAGVAPPSPHCLHLRLTASSESVGVLIELHSAETFFKADVWTRHSRKSAE